jgi:hypothetical protein
MPYNSTENNRTTGKRGGKLMNVKAPKVTPVWLASDEPELKTALDPLAYLYELLQPVEKVVALYADRHPDGFDIWIVADATTAADREQIYDREWALMQQFPGLGFDFRLLDRAQSVSGDLVDLDNADLFLRLPRFAYA